MDNPESLILHECKYKDIEFKEERVMEYSYLE